MLEKGKNKENTKKARTSKRKCVNEISIIMKKIIIIFNNKRWF